MRTKCDFGKVLRSVLRPDTFLALGALLLMGEAQVHAEAAAVTMPSTAAQPAVAQPAPARIGIAMSESNPASGVLVTHVYPGGPADKAGLRPKDLILAVDARSVTNPTELQAAVAQHRPGDTLELSVIRDGRRRQFALISVDQAAISRLPAPQPTNATARRAMTATPQTSADAPSLRDIISDPYLRARYTNFGE